MSDVERLCAIYDALDDDGKRSLQNYAEYLAHRSGTRVAVPVLSDPVDIPRPDDESVIGAIKRLKLTYPMIDNMSVFSAASSLMTEHMVQGRAAADVIDEMENVFHDAYLQMKEG